MKGTTMLGWLTGTLGLALLLPNCLAAQEPNPDAEALKKLLIPLFQGEIPSPAEVLKLIPGKSLSVGNGQDVSTAAVDFLSDPQNNGKPYVRPAPGASQLAAKAPGLFIGGSPRIPESVSLGGIGGVEVTVSKQAGGQAEFNVPFGVGRPSVARLKGIRLDMQLPAVLQKVDPATGNPLPGERVALSFPPVSTPGDFNFDMGQGILLGPISLPLCKVSGAPLTLGGSVWLDFHGGLNASPEGIAAIAPSLPATVRQSFDLLTESPSWRGVVVVGQVKLALGGSSSVTLSGFVTIDEQGLVTGALAATAEQSFTLTQDFKVRLTEMVIAFKNSAILPERTRVGGDLVRMDPNTQAPIGTLSLSNLTAKWNAGGLVLSGLLGKVGEAQQIPLGDVALLKVPATGAAFVLDLSGTDNVPWEGDTESRSIIAKAPWPVAGSGSTPQVPGPEWIGFYVENLDVQLTLGEDSTSVKADTLAVGSTNGLPAIAGKITGTNLQFHMGNWLVRNAGLTVEASYFLPSGAGGSTGSGYTRFKLTDLQGTLIVPPEVDANAPTLALKASGIDLESGGLIASITPTHDLPLELSGTGLKLTVPANKPIVLDLSESRSPRGLLSPTDWPSSDPTDPISWKGLRISEVEAVLPLSTSGGDSVKVKAWGLAIGTGGLSGTIATTTPIDVDAEGFVLTLNTVNLRFVNSAPVEAELKGKIKIRNLEDREVLVEIMAGGGGAWGVSLGTPVTLPGDSRWGEMSLELRRLSVGRESGNGYVEVDGTLTLPPASGASGQVDVQALRIDTSGSFSIGGGRLMLPSPVDIGTAGLGYNLRGLSFGKDGADKFLGLIGDLRVPDIIPVKPAGDEVRFYYPSGTVTIPGIIVNVTIDGLGSLNGRIEKKDHRVEGELEVILQPLKVTAGGKICITKIGADTAWFVSTNVQLPTGIQLSPYPIAIYGFSGGFGRNVSLKVKEDTFPRKIVDADEHDVTAAGFCPTPNAGGIVCMLGATIGTSDNGYTFNSEVAVLLSLPGPVLAILGDAWLATDRNQRPDGPAQWHSELIWSGDALSISLSGHYRVQEQGELLDLHGAAEGFFSKDEWHFFVGRREEEYRLRAQILKFGKAKAFFMTGNRIPLSGRIGVGYLTGASIQIGDAWSVGPAELVAKLWAEGDMEASVDPLQVGVNIGMGGELKGCVLGKCLGVSLKARMKGCAPQPFNLEANAEVTLDFGLDSVEAEISFSRTDADQTAMKPQDVVASVGFVDANTGAQVALAVAGTTVPVESVGYITLRHPALVSDDGLSADLEPLMTRNATTTVASGSGGSVKKTYKDSIGKLHIAPVDGSFGDHDLNRSWGYEGGATGAGLKYDRWNDYQEMKLADIGDLMSGGQADFPLRQDRLAKRHRTLTFSIKPRLSSGEKWGFLWPEQSYDLRLETTRYVDDAPEHKDVLRSFKTGPLPASVEHHVDWTWPPRNYRYHYTSEDIRVQFDVPWLFSMFNSADYPSTKRKPLSIRLEKEGLSQDGTRHSTLGDSKCGLEFYLTQGLLPSSPYSAVVFAEELAAGTPPTNPPAARFRFEFRTSKFATFPAMVLASNQADYWKVDNNTILASFGRAVDWDRWEAVYLSGSVADTGSGFSLARPDREDDCKRPWPVYRFQIPGTAPADLRSGPGSGRRLMLRPLARVAGAGAAKILNFETAEPIDFIHTKVYLGTVDITARRMSGPGDTLHVFDIGGRNVTPTVLLRRRSGDLGGGITTGGAALSPQDVQVKVQP